MPWVVALGYLSGSWLGALSVCRLAGAGSPYRSGSGNPGFSNVLRLHGMRLALATLLVDVVKGMPVLALALALGFPPWAQGLVGLAVLLGHSYPVWHRFSGGKAVASAFGAMLLLTPGVALLCATLWALLAWRVRTAAVASLISAGLAPLASLWLAPDYVSVVLAFTALVLARHLLNIRRLRHGDEPVL
ncbi:glycerol-3-phosphate 1-O-acyltransferase PlsY [Halomonas sp. NO4]|uniref:glycerol-3-phosphate 1-O-acyltransferase PlsY n=1 Tax=Halomonas sp. NO4 TaxID=2484813 RepID=UPI0013D8C5F3|nr:glycerol-3-phosphate 1-O-acyltransferase PlsY [Halomonas sp. NO4]